jgi:hypothetical protein
MEGFNFENIATLSSDAYSFPILGERYLYISNSGGSSVLAYNMASR